MKLQIFSIHDSKAQAFLAPFFMQNVEMAKRTFTECANDSAHMFCKHSSDFTLYHVGSFDDENAELINHEPKINLGFASNYKGEQS